MKVVAYVLGVIKMYLGSSLDPKDPRSTCKSPKGSTGLSTWGYTYACLQFFVKLSTQSINPKVLMKLTNCLMSYALSWGPDGP